jgi:transposase
MSALWAAERLGLSASLIEQLVIRYQESGAAGLMSRKRDHPRLADWMSN